MHTILHTHIQTWYFDLDVPSLSCMQDVSSLEDLLLHLHAHGLVSTLDIMTGLATFTISLEDIRCGLQQNGMELIMHEKKLCDYALSEGFCVNFS